MHSSLKYGLVVTGHKKATEAGLNILKKGGNAMDAAIAAASTLAVAIPNMNGLGGDSIGLWYDAKKNKIITINGSGKSPKKATKKFFKSRGLKSIPRRGPLSISVPGVIHAWETSIKLYGRKKFKEVLNNSIKLAKNGLKIDNYLRTFLKGKVYNSLIKKNKNLSEVYGNGKKDQKISILKQKKLSKTLEIIAKYGANSFYKGSLSKKILKDINDQGSIISAEDLKNHKTLIQKPISTTFLNKKIYTAPPNSQGLALLIMCNLFKSNNKSKNINVNEFYNNKKLAYKFRDKFCIDPSDSKLTKKILNKKNLKIINRYKKNVSGDTSTLVVVDKDGNAVSWVQSLFEEFGSGIMSPSTGVVMHNRLYLEKIVGDSRNLLKSNKRPFHTLSPALVLDRNKCDLAIATPGDHGQPQTLFQILFHVYKNNFSIQKAINQPRIRHDVGKTILVEKNFFKDFKNKKKFLIKTYKNQDRIFGGVTAIKRNSSNILLRGADKRRNCY